MWPKRFFKSACLLFILLVSAFCVCRAYSVLTHEAIIDASWSKFIVPLLKEKYPSLSDSELKEAHAYAYGGCVAPDMGYYPRGSKLFTNLVHYVRSGDFVNALLQEAQNPNEYAFAIGFLCHYYADKYGHSMATNLSVPMEYPRVERKFGDTATYADNKISHKRMEFAFDVLQVARGNYASAAYHDYIGFKVAQPVLERAFRKVYGVDINSLFKNLPRAIGTFRWAVKNLMPSVTKAAWATRRAEIQKIDTTATARKFIYKMRRQKYNREFGEDYKRPKFGTVMFGIFLRIVPKVGPLRALKFKEATPATEKLFVKSFDSAQYHYCALLTTLPKKKVVLKNIDYDTGNPTAEDEYLLADKTYGDLTICLKKHNFDSLDAPLKQNIVLFYSGGTTSKYTQKHHHRWKRINRALNELKASKTVTADNG